jgi:hypothetical protein
MRVPVPGRRLASELIGGLGGFAGLDSSGEDKDADEDAGGGEPKHEDGAAEGLALVRGGTRGGIFAEAAALGVADGWQGESECKQKDSRRKEEKQVLRLRLAQKARQTSLRMTAC